MSGLHGGVCVAAAQERPPSITNVPVESKNRTRSVKTYHISSVILIDIVLTSFTCLLIEICMYIGGHVSKARLSQHGKILTIQTNRYLAHVMMNIQFTILVWGNNIYHSDYDPLHSFLLYPLVILQIIVGLLSRI